jgi:hypothetical protein
MLQLLEILPSQLRRDVSTPILSNTSYAFFVRHPKSNRSRVRDRGTKYFPRFNHLREGGGLPLLRERLLGGKRDVRR